MSSYVFQFFCGDGRGPFRPAQVQVQGQTRPKALTAQPHPPPRPTSAPRPARLRQRPAEDEGQESSPRRTHRRRRRSPSRSASPRRARTATAWSGAKRTSACAAKAYRPPSPQVYAQQYVPDMRRPAHPVRPPSNRLEALRRLSPLLIKLSSP